jgi:predicted choloylglycine hydrolase
MNDAGLAVSLTFGGSRATGLGFGIPVVLRYLLQTCTTVAESRAALSRVPLNLAHNVTVVDAGGEVMRAYLGPGREPAFLDVAVAPNHQVAVEWQEHAAATRTLERETLMQSLLAADVPPEEFEAAFLAPPLYSSAYSRGFGALPAYRPREGRADYRWPGGLPWTKTFEEFPQDVRTELLTEATAA